MRSIIIVLAVVLSVAGCGGSESDESGRHYTHEQHAYSIALPKGWKVSQVRGFAQLSPKGDSARRKHTIFIRSIEKPREIREGQPATEENIVASTERVLRALPRAKVSKHTRVPGTQLPGVRFSLSFVPRGLTSTYRREHALLVGSKHIYHVIYTSPANEPMDEASFRAVATTLTEEGV